MKAHATLPAAAGQMSCWNTSAVLNGNASWNPSRSAFGLFMIFLYSPRAWSLTVRRVDARLPLSTRSNDGRIQFSGVRTGDDRFAFAHKKRRTSLEIAYFAERPVIYTRQSQYIGWRASPNPVKLPPTWRNRNSPTPPS